MVSGRRLPILILAILAVLLAELPVAAQVAAPAGLSVLVTDLSGGPLPGVTVEAGAVTATTDPAGRAHLAGVGAGVVTVTHPAAGSRSVDWDGTGDRLRIPLGRSTLRALHIPGSFPTRSEWADLLALADRTALNAVMLDLKDESGLVHAAWSGSAPAPPGLGSWDLDAVVDEVHARGLAVIVRVVAFQDPRLAGLAPSSAVFDSRTGGPFTRGGQVFLDPTDPVPRRYVRELAEAACAAGVDEVQLDYIRFPDGLRPELRFDGVDATDEAQRVATITDYVAELRSGLPAGCALSADVFGFVTSIAGDGGIGQDLDVLAGALDVLSPMVYPNHWGRGWFGFAVPANHPGEVVTASMSNARDRLGDRVGLRPWLQDFGGYGPGEVRAQIDAADRLGMGWMLWNASGRYTTAALPTDAEMRTPADPPAARVQWLPRSGFWDVTAGHTFAADVEWTGSETITRGCNPPWRDEYCPERPVTRGEAATFLARALDLPPGPDRFADDDGTTHEASIDALAAAGITRGCGPDRYCPHDWLTRAQMASLLARALQLPVATGDTFRDDDGSTHEADIERIAAPGITRGCGPGRFCPLEPVTRGQMAAFLHRALGD
ncbi:MAG: putative glycoside hydrolase [Acidimicrobiales bacterium]